MTKLIFTVGLPASGKSTWAKQYCKDTGAFQVERDQIRIDNNLPFGTDEDRVTDIQRAILMSVLRVQDAVVSDLNLAPRYRNSLIEFVKQKVPGTEVCYKLFTDVDLFTCLARNELRPEAEHIPGQVITKLHNDCIQTNKYMKGIAPERIMP